MPLKDIPVGSLIHNIELRPGKGGQLVRSAGTVAQLMAKEGPTPMRLLGEVRIIMLTPGYHRPDRQPDENMTLGKAGRPRWLGIRPTVRGSVMNPADHPMAVKGEPRSAVSIRYHPGQDRYRGKTCKKTF